MRWFVLLRTTLFLMSAACLATAYLLGGYWLIAPGLLACLAFWYVLHRQSVLGRSAYILTFYVATAAAGVIIGLYVPILVVGVAAALAAWDLVNFEAIVKLALHAEVREALLRSHLRSLFVAMGAGLFLAAIAMLVRIDIPFAATGALALGLVVALMMAARRMSGSVR